MVRNNDLRRNLVTVQFDVFWKHVHALPRDVVLPEFHKCYSHWL